MFKEVKKIVSKSTLAAVAIMAASQGQAMEKVNNYRSYPSMPEGMEKYPHMVESYNNDKLEFERKEIEAERKINQIYINKGVIKQQCAQDLQHSQQYWRDVRVAHEKNQAAISANFDTTLNNLKTVQKFAISLIPSDKNMAPRIMRVAGDDHCAAIANIITQSANDPILANRANLVANYLNQHGL